MQATTEATIVRSDTYYLDESKKVLEAALSEARSRGLSEEEIRFHLHRAYPFGLPRKGQPYKVWRKTLLEMEDELGYSPRPYRQEAPKTNPKSNVKIVPDLRTVSDLDALKPVDRESAARFLRRYCRTVITMYSDHDRIRVTLKGSDRNESNIKFEMLDKVDHDDPEGYRELFIRLAHGAWEAWKKLESEKL